MGDSGHGELALRIERGRASDDELAALTVVLLALYAGGAAEDGDERPFNGSRWWRRPDAYKAPRSWQ
jgi:hypothetical protein